MFPFAERAVHFRYRFLTHTMAFPLKTVIDRPGIRFEGRDPWGGVPESGAAALALRGEASVTGAVPGLGGPHAGAWKGGVFGLGVFFFFFSHLGVCVSQKKWACRFQRRPSPPSREWIRCYGSALFGII